MICLRRSRRSWTKWARRFPTCPPFIQGKIVGYTEAVQAMSRDQPQEKAG